MGELYLVDERIEAGEPHLYRGEATLEVASPIRTAWRLI